MAFNRNRLANIRFSSVFQPFLVEKVQIMLELKVLNNAFLMLFFQKWHLMLNLMLALCVTPQSHRAQASISSTCQCANPQCTSHAVYKAWNQRLLY